MNLASIIDGHPADHVALVSRNRPTTYGALRDQVAARPRRPRRPRRRRAAIASRCCAATGASSSSRTSPSLGLGAVAVPLNPTSPAPELARELAAVGATVVVVDPSAAAAWPASTAPRCRRVEHVVATEARPVARVADVDVRRAARRRAGRRRRRRAPTTSPC